MAKKHQEQTVDTQVPPLPQEELSDLEKELNTIGALEPGMVSFDGPAPVVTTVDGEGQALYQARSSYSDPVIKPYSAVDELIELQKQVGDLRLDLEAKLQAAVDEMKSISAARDNGISARLVGGMFDCPMCGLRIDGPSLTAIKSKPNQGVYQHPYAESPQLGGKQCELKGATFKAPIIYLERVG